MKRLVNALHTPIRFLIKMYKNNNTFQAPEIEKETNNKLRNAYPRDAGRALGGKGGGQ